MKSSTRFLGIISVLGLAGCGSMVGSALSSAGSSIGSGIGTAVGDRIGAAAGSAMAARMPAMWTPDMTPIYMNYLFTMAFHSGSYTLEGTDYEPGQWTRWRMTETQAEGEAPIMERAFLADAEDGNEWWRVKYISDTEEGRDSITVEGLFNRESGEVVRMRGKMPGEPEAKEMPVQEGTYGYAEPTRLTRESMEGALVGRETVRVPAGTFSADHIRYGSMEGGQLDWWLEDTVPGGMVKYSRSHSGSADEGLDPHNWTVELIAHGRDAKSDLGVQF